jgi:hypothetical protein
VCVLKYNLRLDFKFIIIKLSEEFHIKLLFPYIKYSIPGTPLQMITRIENPPLQRPSIFSSPTSNLITILLKRPVTQKYAHHLKLLF